MAFPDNHLPTLSIHKTSFSPTTNLKPVALVAFLLLWMMPQQIWADRETGRMQLLRAKNLMKVGDFGNAWKMLNGFQKSDTSTAELYYLGGTCLFQLKLYPDAISQFERSIRLSPNEDIRKYYLLGRVYHAGAEPEKAILAYEKFLSFNTGDKEDLADAKEYLAQSRRAIEWMQNPLDVSIRNMGDSINSEYPEYNPSLTADGNTLIFTSRRPETTGKTQDPNDGLFMEDIYISHKNPHTGKWSEAVPVEGALNTPAHDANLCLSPDGSQIFVYVNKGNSGSGEIYVSKKNKNGKWSAAKKVEGGVNSSYFESSACISPDGKQLYFVSEREKKAYGMADIYVSQKISKTEWGEPVNLGPVINDEYDQIGVFIHPDGKTIYFASDNPKGMGGFDIYKSSFADGSWSQPENLKYPINTTGDDRFIHLSVDGKTAWISSDRPGGKGMIDIWEIDISRLSKQDASGNILPDAGLMAILSGQITDAQENALADIEIQITDPQSQKKHILNSDENGEYFIMLTGNRNYQVNINSKGYKPLQFEIFIQAKESETFNNQKMIVLE